MGLRSYLTAQPGIGGRLRSQPEDFQVIELGPGPKASEGAPFAAARVRLRNWETNRFAGIAARRIGIKPGRVGFAGMKDKRAVTEQWFTFQAPLDRARRIEELDDVTVLEWRQCKERQYAGAHDGNRFVVRVRDHDADPETTKAIEAAIRQQGGVPGFFGPQRFGAAFRPITHLVGKAIVEDALEEAVRLYLGHPMPSERQEAYEARKVYEETRDPEATLQVWPPHLGPEQAMLERLVKRPGDWRHALRALPGNLLQLFIHAHQSWVFNEILSQRIKQGWGLGEVQVGDRVCAFDDDGTATHVVTATNKDRIEQEIVRGRASATALLPGLGAPLAEGEPGALEQEVLDRLDIDLASFRCYEMPDLASQGRRRNVLQHVGDLDVSWVDGDPVLSFALGKGDYATTVLREFMKTEVGAY